MTGMRGRAPGPSPQPPITQPQQPAMPTQPVGPQQPSMPVQPQVPQQPVMPPQPTAPTPSPYEYYKVKEGEIVIVFAKGLTQEGLPTETTRKFSSNDPQVVEIICWGPNTLAAGTNLASVWYYNNNAVYNNYYKVEENKFIAIDVIQRPASGFPPGEYTVYVGVNDTPVLSHSFTVQ